MKSGFRKKNRKAIFSFLIILSIVLLSFWGWGSYIKNSILFVASPALKTVSLFAHATKDFFSFFASIGDLKEENKKLIEGNKKLFSQNIELEDLRKENEDLRRQLDLSPREEFDLVAAFVIAQDWQGRTNLMVINKGEKNGIKKGMPVIVYDKNLLGKVSEVFGNSSVVRLHSDPQSFINVEVMENGAKGILRGDFGLGTIMDMIGQNYEIKAGYRVITSGLGDESPRGLFVGTIKEVRDSPDRLFKQALISPPFDAMDIRSVFVIKAKK